MFFAQNGFNTDETVNAQTEGFGPAVAFNSLKFLNQQFAYDNLHRLSSVTDSNYSRSDGYDEFGNLSVTANSTVALSYLTPFNNGTVNPFNPATNHVVMVDAAGGYEARGHVTKLGAVTMAYDAESNMKSVAETGGQSFTWIYDAEGQRAQKLIAGGSWTVYIHDALGQLAAEYNNLGVTPACVTCYLTYDMLGSVRMVTNESQSLVARHDYIPFGEEIPDGTAGRSGSFASTSNLTQGFTGQEADGGLASLDYFNARHLAGVLGAFVQVDPGNAGADITSPQSWNAYGYVLGNPLGFVDPSGMYLEANPKDPDGGDTGDYCEFGCGPVDIFSPGDGGGGGGGGGEPAGPVIKIVPPAKNGPQIGPAPPAYTQLLPCVKQQYGFLAAGAAMTAAGQPIGGTKRFVTPGSSIGTSLASKVSRTLLSGIKFSEPLPTPVGGLFTGRAFAMATTKDAGAFLGRWVPFVGEALVAYDAAKIGSCVVNGLSPWQPKPAYIDTGVGW